MLTKGYSKKITAKFVDKILSRLYILLKILKYKLLSTCSDVQGKPTYLGPVLLKGKGKIRFGENISIGYLNSPQFFNSYCYIESRGSESVISIGDGVKISNNACILSEGEGISIGNNTLVGHNFVVFDSDFHDLTPSLRITGSPKTKRVIIGKNVFIGSNVTILKGVEIGDNSVIGSNSVVISSIPSNSVAAGNPCKKIKDL